VPALAYKIHQSNPTAQLKINMKGVAIGDGLCDPVNVCTFMHTCFCVCTYAYGHTVFSQIMAGLLAGLITM